MAKGKALLKPPNLIQAQVQETQVGQRIPKLRGVHSCLCDSNNKKQELFLPAMKSLYAHPFTTFFLCTLKNLIKTIAIMGFWEVLFAKTCWDKVFFHAHISLQKAG